MYIADLIKNAQAGQVIQAELRLPIGEVDVLALKLLGQLYEALGDKATFADAERVLAEATWWLKTFNVLADAHDASSDDREE